MYTLKDGSVVVSVPESYTGLAISHVGTKFWHKAGNLHRTNGPAWAPTTGAPKRWYREGYPHCTIGPALDWGGGDKSWLLEGKYLKKQTKVVLVCTL